MNRLVTRLVVSHLLVAVLGGASAFAVSRLLAPRLFDMQMHMRGSGMGSGMGMGQQGQLRSQFGTAVDQALVAGTLIGIIAAAAFGIAAAYRIVRPVNAVRSATRDLAAGRYRTDVPAPRETELAELATDINSLGHTLAGTEARRVALLGEVSHEMRTPLTVIDGYVEAMIDGVVPPEPESLARISDEVRRLRRLSEDLSALSRSDEGRVELRLAEVDVADVVRSAAERLRPQAEDGGVTLDVGAVASPVPARVDADRVAQIVTNLVGNALVATPRGGTVRVACHPGPDAIEVVVADTGIGIPREELARVFERFYRVPGRDRRSGGTGVGLTIARSLARAHAGELVVRSAGEGHGTTATVTLPRR